MAEREDLIVDTQEEEPNFSDSDDFVDNVTDEGKNKEFIFDCFCFNLFVLFLLFRVVATFVLQKAT